MEITKLPLSEFTICSVIAQDLIKRGGPDQAVQRVQAKQGTFTHSIKSGNLALYISTEDLRCIDFRFLPQTLTLATTTEVLLEALHRVLARAWVINLLTGKRFTAQAMGTTPEALAIADEAFNMHTLNDYHKQQSAALINSALDHILQLPIKTLDDVYH